MVKKFDYNDLKVIGCLCFVIVKGIFDKFFFRGGKCILIGYFYDYKGYKFYDLNFKDIY